MHQFYITVDGPGFDARKFHESYGMEGRDQIRSKKRMIAGNVQIIGEYWKSESLKFTLWDSCEPLSELISRLEPGLASLPETIPARAVLALGLEEGELHGYYLSAELMLALGKLKCDLEVCVPQIV